MFKGDLFYNQQRIKLSQSPHIIVVNQNQVRVTLSCYSIDARSVIQDRDNRASSLSSLGFGDQHMNNTIIRLTVSATGSLHILYAHMLPLFRREHAYTQMTANATGIKNPASLRARWSGRHLRLSPLGAANETTLLSRSLACVHVRVPTDLTLVKVIFAISKPCVCTLIEAQSRVRRRYDLSGVSTGAHTSLINIPTVGTTYNCGIRDTIAANTRLFIRKVVGA